MRLQYVICLFALVLSACAIKPTTQVEVVALPVEAPPAPEPLPPISDGHEDVSDVPIVLWDSLVEGRRYGDCDEAEGIQRWIKRLAGSGKRFADEMNRVAPYVDYVWREAQFQEMPAEVALLPLVESSYRPVIGGYGAPGGWWQLMPATARLYGLRVDGTRDERLDPLSGTLAALTMLKQLGKQFEGNWLLALIGYNVGPRHVERWISKAGLSHDTVTRVDQLPVPRVTLDHIHRLQAFGCVLAYPERYQVELPTLPEHEQLYRITLEREVPPHALVAALGARGEEWQRQHPGLFKKRMLSAGQAVLAPKDIHERLAGLGDLARFEREPARTTRASKVSVPPSSPGERAKRPDFHIVGQGDSLWLIARRHDMRVNELLSLNPGLSRRTVLKLGRKLRLK